MAVTFILTRQIAQPAVGMDHTALLDRVLKKRHQAVRGGVRNAPVLYALDARSVFFRCNCKHCFGFCLPSVNPFLLASYQSLVYLYAPAEPIAARAHHGAAQFMQQRPGRPSGSIMVPIIRQDTRRLSEIVVVRSCELRSNASRCRLYYEGTESVFLLMYSFIIPR